MIPQTLATLLTITLFSTTSADKCRCIASLDPYEPVCCNGQDFSNLCAACNAGGFDESECTDGDCVDKLDKCRCIASLDPHEPVCCNGQDFSNPCAACNAGGFDESECTDGECEDLLLFKNCNCIAQYDPVCCDGTTYSNECKAKCVYNNQRYGSQCTEGACGITSADKCRCIASLDPYEPVCCNGQDFSNPCAACNAGGFDQSECTDGECEGNAYISGDGVVNALYMSVFSSEKNLKWNNGYLYMVFAVVVLAFVITKCYGGFYGEKKSEREPLLVVDTEYGAISSA